MREVTGSLSTLCFGFCVLVRRGVIFRRITAAGTTSTDVSACGGQDGSGNPSSQKLERTA